MPAHHPTDRALQQDTLPPCVQCGAQDWRPTAFRNQCRQCEYLDGVEHPILVAEREGRTGR